MKKNNEEIRYEFNKAFLSVLKTLKAGECITGTAIVDEFIYPILCIGLSKKDVKLFGIDMISFQIGWRFRSLIDRDLNISIDIGLRFENKKILSALLNPIHENIRHFMRMIYRKKNIGFYFHCREMKVFAGTIFTIDSEQNAWLERNIPQFMMLQKNDFEEIKRTRTTMKEPAEKFYAEKFSDTYDLFIKPNDELISMDSVHPFLFHNS